MTQAQLAEQMDYSLSFIASIESKKYQSFSLGALWRISLILGIDMYKLCIDENQEQLEKPKFIKYKCEKCNYETDIPYELIELLNKANSISNQHDKNIPTFNCANCDGIIKPKENNY